jgi:hypothetical protein
MNCAGFHIRTLPSDLTCSPPKKARMHWRQPASSGSSRAIRVYVSSVMSQSRTSGLRRTFGPARNARGPRLLRFRVRRDETLMIIQVLASQTTQLSPRYRELTASASCSTFIVWVSLMYTRGCEDLTAVAQLVTCGFSLTRVQSTRCFPRKPGGRYDLDQSARWNSHWRMARRSSAVFPSVGLRSGARQPHHRLC